MAQTPRNAAFDIEEQACAQSQHSLYSFLMQTGQLLEQVTRLVDEVARLTRRQDATEADVQGLRSEVTQLKEQTENVRKDLISAKKDIDAHHTRQDEKLDQNAESQKESKEMLTKLVARQDAQDKRLKPLLMWWSKTKNGALILLAAYFLKDSPEVLKLVLGVLK